MAAKIFEVLGIGREQHQRAQAGRADGIALGHRLGGVADGIERVGGLADLLRHAGHLGDAAGVVGDGTKGVERHDHAGEREHGGDGDGDAEQAGKAIGDEDARDDHERGQRRRFHRYGKALDDVGAVAGDGGLSDGLHRAIVGAGVIFGDDHDQRRDHQAHGPAQKQRFAGEGEIADRHHRVHADEPSGERPEQDEGENAGRQHALIEGAHDRLALAEPHEKRADDRGDDADARRWRADRASSA